MVAIEAITGKYPRDLPDDPKTMEVVWQPGTPVSPALAKLLTNMVRFNYSLRYANGKEALQALEAALAPPAPTVVVSPKAPEPKPQPQPKKQGWLQALFGPADVPEPDDLSSEKGIDYTHLRDLLKIKDWCDADSETYNVMIRAVGKKSGDWFTRDELLNFPCTDLRTIDGLWVKYSQGKFGFSVQKKIYAKCGATLDGQYRDDKIYRDLKLKESFSERVGWRKWDNSYLDMYRDLRRMYEYDLRHARRERTPPAGLFPCACVWGGLAARSGGVEVVSSLAQRLVTCSTSQF
jgi:hypothetical protein